MIRHAVKARKLDQRGLTLVELVIVMGMTALFVAIISVFAFNYWRYAYRLQADQDAFIDRLNAGDLIRESMGTSSGLINENSITDAHATNVDPTDGAGYWQTIHAIPQTIAMPSAGTTAPVAYYKRYSVTNNGSFIMNGSAPYEDEYVLYLDGSTKQLLLRSLANSAAASNRLKTSCPPNIATTTCPADKILARNITSVSTRYFSRTGNLMDWTSIFDTNTNSYAGPDYPAVEVVEFTLNISAKAALTPGNSTINSTIIRIALRNA